MAYAQTRALPTSCGEWAFRKESSSHVTQHHFALKSKIYQSALRSAYAELVKLNPQPLAA